MLKHIIAIAFVFFCTALGWVVLGATVRIRTHDQDDKLRQSVHQLWDAPQIQQAPMPIGPWQRTRARTNTSSP